MTKKTVRTGKWPCSSEYPKEVLERIQRLLEGDADWRLEKKWFSFKTYDEGELSSVIVLKIENRWEKLVSEFSKDKKSFWKN